MVGVFRVEPYAIIADLDVVIRSHQLGSDNDDRRYVLADIFKGIGHQVNKELRYLKGDGLDGRKGFAFDQAFLLFNDQFVFGFDVFHDVFQVHAFKTGGFRGKLGVGEDIPDECLHPGGGPGDPFQVSFGGLVQVAGAAFKHLGISADLPDGLLQVVGGDIGELPEFGIGSLEMGIGGGEFFGAVRYHFFSAARNCFPSIMGILRSRNMTSTLISRFSSFCNASRALLSAVQTAEVDTSLIAERKIS